MKKLVFALLLLQTAAVFAVKPSTNPDDYPITVHVVFSRYITTDLLNGYQQLDTVINGQQVELQGTGLGVLTPGDYKAELFTTYTALGGGALSFIPKHSNPSDNFLVYRFLLPDGSTRQFDVVGLGPKTPDGTPSTH